MSADPAAAAHLIAALPKTETHLHLEGALPFRLLQGLDPRRHAAAPRAWAEDFRYPTFKAFEDELIDMVVPWFQTAERYHEAATVLFADKQEQGVRYLETSFHAGIIEFVGIPGEEIVEAIRQAIPAGMFVRVFMGLPREGSPIIRQAAVECLGWKGLDGIDLHGPEAPAIEDWTREIWPAAREVGKITKAHAGEFGGADNVREVVAELGVRRVQHGVRAWEDDTVVALCAREGVIFDVCPWSNLKLKVVPSMEAHPLLKLREAGVVCTVNTDDPLIFGTRLADEYAAVVSAMGGTPADIVACARDGFNLPEVPEEVRTAALAEIERIAGEHGVGA